MKKILVFAAMMVASTGWGKSDGASGMSGWEAYSELQSGNMRFYDGEPKHPRQNKERREELANGQKPHTIVISCSDSRVPPEEIFDQGLGDVFSVRLAGNVATTEAIASVEYAIEHLGSKLLVVMGHESCGAVKAAIEVPSGKTAGTPNLDELLAKIRPNVADVKDVQGDPKLLRAPVKSNVRAVVKDLLSRSEVVRTAVESHGLIIAQAIYSLKTGRVEFWDVGSKGYVSNDRESVKVADGQVHSEEMPKKVKKTH